MFEIKLYLINKKFIKQKILHVTMIANPNAKKSGYSDSPPTLIGIVALRLLDISMTNKLSIYLLRALAAQDVPQI